MINGVEYSSAELIVGGVYEVRSRNLVFAVWDGAVWIGLRRKFGEWNLDCSEISVKPLRFICQLPKEIEPTMGWTSRDRSTVTPGCFLINSALFGYLMRVMDMTDL